MLRDVGKACFYQKLPYAYPQSIRQRAQEILFPSPFQRCHSRQHRLRIQDADIVALLDTFDRQRSDKGSAHAGAVFGGKNFDWVVAASKSPAFSVLFPVEDFFQSLRTALLQIGLLVSANNDRPRFSRNLP